MTSTSPQAGSPPTEDDGRPTLFTNATIRTRDPVIGDVPAGDVLLGGELVVAVGPGLITAAGDDNANVVDCTGMTIVPALVETFELGVLRPGNRADLAIIENGLAGTIQEAVRTMASRPGDVSALVSAGRIVRWDGQDLEAAPEEDVPSHVGVWIDETGFLHQELTADGRYDETRGGRQHAFQGWYWVNGDRVDYLDDLGFWAFGEFRGDELHHAGYTMRLHDEGGA